MGKKKGGEENRRYIYTIKHEIDTTVKSQIPEMLPVRLCQPLSNLGLPKRAILFSAIIVSSKRKLI